MFGARRIISRGSLANGHSPDPAGLAPKYSKCGPLTVSFRSQFRVFVRLVNAIVALLIILAAVVLWDAFRS